MSGFGIDPQDVYFGLVCLLAVLVLALILDYYVEYINKEGDEW